MKEGNSKQWRQMEWIGFYFEFLCENSSLKNIMKFKKIKYGDTTFDGFLEIPFDFKTHVLNSKDKNIILNDTEAVEKAIKEYDSISIIIALGEAVFDDENRTFYKWHEKLKGEKSKYVKEAEKRGATSRRRKASFNLEKIIIVKVDEKILEKSKSFRQGRNSNGTSRKPKVILNLNECEIVEEIKF